MTSKVVDTNFESGIVNNNVWIESWAVGDTDFHQETSDPFLDEKNEEMFDGKTKSVFLPLCGKTYDMIWMYERGHTVCGVEIAEQPVKEFFEEHNIDTDIERVGNVGSLYKSKDERLKLFVADVFDMSVTLCGQFDIIWDSKSLVAINIADHQLYRDTMLALMKPGGKYYLSTLEYDPAVWPGPPHSFSDKTVRDLFGVLCTVDMLEENGKDEPVALPKVDPKQRDSGKPFSGTAQAISSSSYIYTRWYKMMSK